MLIRIENNCYKLKSMLSMKIVKVLKQAIFSLKNNFLRFVS